MDIIQTSLLVVVLCVVLYIASKQQTTAGRTKGATKYGTVIVDSSALIDGRIIEVAKSGFLSLNLIIPSSVLREMQYLADTGDATKRSRARHGLDVVKQLQDTEDTEVTILEDGEVDSGGVDDRLIELAKKTNGRILTLDFNLSKVAIAEGINILNLNQLAQSLRMAYLPGEKRHITLVQKGQDKTQAVGYLEDGTMVVVENANKYIGQSVEVEFIRAIQTQAGKMLFAKKTSVEQTQQVASIPTKKQNRPAKRSTKKTPEDSLVELANQ